MKGQKGITLISVIIYIIVMLIVIGIVANITKYFYHNVSIVNDDLGIANVFTSFNAYFTDEVNISGNEVINCDGNSIKFKHNENVFLFKDEKIYYNKIIICKDVSSCLFSYDENKKIIVVEIKVGDKTFNNSYSITKISTVSSKTDILSDFYDKFTNIFGCGVKSCNEQSILFNDNNKFEYNTQEQKIYFNNNVIAENIKLCKFMYDTEKKVITLEIQKEGKKYINSYAVTNNN